MDLNVPITCGTVGEGLAPPETRLSEIGRIAEEQILALEERFPSVSIDRYVVMPNHIHILLLLREQAGGASPSPTTRSESIHFLFCVQIVIKYTPGLL